MSLSIILPAFNEAESLRKLLPELNERFPDAEILVVNDGSLDETVEVCNQYDCSVITQPYNMGNGAAIKRGAREASGDVLAFLDADGQHTAESLATLLNSYADAKYDMIVGWRESSGHASKWRRFANSLFNRLASWMTNQKIMDLTSGIRVVNAEKFKEFIYLLPNGFSYPTTITMAFFRSGYSVSYEPVRVIKRVGNSHIKPLRDGIRFLLIIFKIGSLYSPLKFFIPVSFAVFLLSSAYYGYTFITEGRFTNMSALLYSTSLLVFLIGMVSEQITNLLFSRKQ